MNLLIKNAAWLNGQSKIASGDIRIEGLIISDIGKGLTPRTGIFSKEHVVDISGQFVYPGLINAHDHLEMNLYPRLGTPPYDNYTQWSADIYRPGQSPLKEIESTEIENRLLWGGLKNLISGVTTVVHHNPWKKVLSKAPVNVWHTEWAHSLAFDTDVRSKKKAAGKRKFAIHAAEGTDDFSRQEIHKLSEMGCLDEHTIIIHGVAMGEAEMKIMENSRASLTWCPSSNDYMFGKTADIGMLKKGIRIVLGSDSTLTGSPTLLDEMRVALHTGKASEEDIARMVGAGAVELFGMPMSIIQETLPANLFIAPQLHTDPIKNLFLLEPQHINAVIVGGKLQLSDPGLDLPHPKQTLIVQGRKKFCRINVKKLKQYFEEKVGKSILSANKLWNIIEG
jgi:cytosine/adenosine deaminase-related metal-dependent hydrolase